MRTTFRELRVIFTKYCNGVLAERIVDWLKEDGAVNVLYMHQELVEELNVLPYLTLIKKGQSQVKLEV